MERPCSSTANSAVRSRAKMLPLFSPLTQDYLWKVGKVVFVAGHSGPETAHDSRTHFGILEPTTMQPLVRGQVINCHPWEYNEVPVLRVEVPIVGLPPLGGRSTSRTGSGCASTGTWRRGEGLGVSRPSTAGAPAGHSRSPGYERRRRPVPAAAGDRKAWPERDAPGCCERRLAISPVASVWRAAPVSKGCAHSPVITTRSHPAMTNCVFREVACTDATSADGDNRWRAGGMLEEAIDEAHPTPPWIMRGIERFVEDQGVRLRRQEAAVAAARE